MKTTLLIFITLIYVECNLAQPLILFPDFELELGKPYNVLDDTHKRYYFPIEAGRAVSIKRVKERMILQLFDTENLTELARNDYREFPSLATVTESSDEHLVQIKDKLYHFLYVYLSDIKSKNMELREIDTKMLNVSSPKRLFEAPKRAYYTYLKLSPDSSKILLGYSLEPSRKDNFEGSSKEFLYVFDANTFEKEWEKVITIPPLTYNGKPIAIHRVKEISMNINGTISMLIGDADYKNFDLYTISKEKVDIKNGLMRLDGEVQELDGNNSCMILQSLSKEHNNLLYLDGQGILSYHLSYEGELLKNEKYTYSLDLITQYLDAKEKAAVLEEAPNGKAAIEGLTLIATLDKVDGGALFISESQIGNQSTTVVNDQAHAPRITYNYKSLILTCLKSDGTVDWIKKIPKNQFNLSSAVVPFYIGTKCLLSKDKKTAYLFYIDIPENLETASDGVPKDYNSRMMLGFLVLCKVNLEDGTYKKHLVADMSDINGRKAINIEINNIFPVVERDNVFLMEVRMDDEGDTLIKITMRK